jgi:hypothetical protein
MFAFAPPAEHAEAVTANTACQMRRSESTKSIVPYAGGDTGASFQSSDDLVYIHNSNGRLHRYIAWTLAAFLIVAPLLRSFMPGTTWFAFDEAGGGGWLGLERRA